MKRGIIFWLIFILAVSVVSASLYDDARSYYNSKLSGKSLITGMAVVGTYCVSDWYCEMDTKCVNNQCQYIQCDFTAYPETGCAPPRFSWEDADFCFNGNCRLRVIIDCVENGDSLTTLNLTADGTEQGITNPYNYCIRTTLAQNELKCISLDTQPNNEFEVNSSYSYVDCPIACVRGQCSEACEINWNCKLGQICQNGVCVIATCTDRIRNQGETGVDCGGLCVACPSCTDRIRNQGETGVDCGGPCVACPSCTDRIRNQGETGVDCGGPCVACCTDSDGINYFKKGEVKLANNPKRNIDFCLTKESPIKLREFKCVRDKVGYEDVLCKQEQGFTCKDGACVKAGVKEKAKATGKAFFKVFLRPYAVFSVGNVFSEDDETFTGFVGKVFRKGKKGMLGGRETTEDREVQDLKKGK